mgnify:CR=1 FL=1
MKTFFDFLFKHNNWESWLWFTGIIISFFILGRIMLWIEKRFLRSKAEKTATKVDDLLLNVFQMPCICGVMLFGLYLSLQMIVFPATFYPILYLAFKVLLLLNITWILNRFIKNVLSDFLLPYATSNKDSKLDVNIIKAIQKVSSGVIWIVAIITALTIVGIDVAAMLTTLGIGGIAFALAAQDMVKSLLSGAVILTDKPFQLGDWIEVGTFSGTVVDITFRSTRIKTINNTLITIPNSVITAEYVINNVFVVNLSVFFSAFPFSFPKEISEIL